MISNRELMKLEKQLNNEAEKQMGIIFPATAIALSKYFDFGPLRIERMFDETAITFKACGDTGTKVSLIQMLDEKVGISLKASPNGKSWKELCFLNEKVNLGTKEKFTDKQWYLMRIEQIKWMAPAVLSAEFIALHDRFRFSRPMLSDLMGYIDRIRQQYKFNANKLSKACYELTGIKMMVNNYSRAEKSNAKEFMQAAV